MTRGRGAGRHIAAVVIVGSALVACSVTAGGGSAGPSSGGSSGSPAPAQRSTLRDAVDDTRSGVVRIETTDCQGGAASGSGFQVGERLVATVAHVVSDGSRSISVRGDDGSVSRAELVATDPDQEVALLRTVHPLGGHSFTFSEPPAVLDRIAVLGFPFGMPLTAGTGRITATGRSIDLEQSTLDGLLQTDATINPGNSGGPVIDRLGAVVGLVEAKSTQADGLAYVVPATTAEPLVAQWSGSSTTVPLAGCPDPASDTVSVDSTHADAPAIALSLATYFDAINSGDYETAWQRLSGSQRATFADLDDFADQYSSVYDTEVSLLSIDSVDATTDIADVIFTSNQDASVGVDAMTCTRWHLAYTLKIDSGFWTISSAANQPGSPALCSETD